jgi:hypothetical protein
VSIVSLLRSFPEAGVNVVDRTARSSRATLRRSFVEADVAVLFQEPQGGVQIGDSLEVGPMSLMDIPLREA